jgi:hypothetical protein
MSLPEKITYYRGKPIDNLSKLELLSIIQSLYKRWKNTCEENSKLRIKSFDLVIDKLLIENKLP